MRCIVRPGLQRQRKNTLDVLIAELARGAGTRLVEQTVDAAIQETLSPLPDGVRRRGQLPGHGGIAESIGGQQDDPRP